MAIILTARHIRIYVYSKFFTYFHEKNHIL